MTAIPAHYYLAAWRDDKTMMFSPLANGYTYPPANDAEALSVGRMAWTNLAIHAMGVAAGLVGHVDRIAVVKTYDERVVVDRKSGLRFGDEMMETLKPDEMIEVAPICGVAAFAYPTDQAAEVGGWEFGRDDEPTFEAIHRTVADVEVAFVRIYSNLQGAGADRFLETANAMETAVINAILWSYDKVDKYGPDGIPDVSHYIDARTLALQSAERMGAYDCHRIANEVPPTFVQDILGDEPLVDWDNVDWGTLTEGDTTS